MSLWEEPISAGFQYVKLILTIQGFYKWLQMFLIISVYMDC